MIYRYLQAIIVAVALVACGGTVDPSGGTSGAGGSGGQVADAGADVEIDAADDAALCGDGSTCTSESGVKCPDGSTCTGGVCVDGACVSPFVGHHLVATSIILEPSTSASVTAQQRSAINCQPCDGWWTIGGRKAICHGKSENLFQAKYGCIQASCGGVCVDWISSYAACMQGSDPACEITVTTACNDCMIASCHSQLLACGDDTLGSVTCNAWIGGADPQRLCGRPWGSSSLESAIILETCACGSCSGPCGTYCGGGLFDPVAGLSDGLCSMCVADSCSSALAACQAN